MSKRRRRCISRTLSNELVEKLSLGDTAPTQLAHEHNVPLTRLARWATEPATVRVLEGLAHLAEVRAQMLLSRYRANAAIQLITIATADEPTELSRKACVDLLKADLRVFDRAERDDAPAAAINEQTIINALEDLAKESADDH